MSWQKVRLGDLCIMNSGGTPSRSNLSYYGGSIPWAKISDIENAVAGVVYQTEEYITSDGLSAINNRIFEAGILLLAMYGSVGKVAFTGVKMSTNQAILGIRIIDESKLNYSYLKYWFMTIKARLLDRAVGGTLQNISLGIVKELEIPLPPLDVQKKIADILDKADALRRKDAELIKKYDELAQSIFIDMFGDPVTNPKGWDIKKLSEICIKITDGTHSTPSYTDSGVPFLRVTDITCSNDSKKFISQLEHRQLIKRCKPERGDILYSKNGTIGVAKVVDWDYEFSIFVSLCLLKIKKEIILSEYLSNYLNTPIALNQAKKHSKTGTVTNLHLNEIREILVPVPCIELQKRYLEKVKNIKLARKVIHDYSEQLFQSLLQRAFNGELVH